GDPCPVARAQEGIDRPTDRLVVLVVDGPDGDVEFPVAVEVAERRCRQEGGVRRGFGPARHVGAVVEVECPDLGRIGAPGALVSAVVGTGAGHDGKTPVALEIADGGTVLEVLVGVVALPALHELAALELEGTEDAAVVVGPGCAGGGVAADEDLPGTIAVGVE